MGNTTQANILLIAPELSAISDANIWALILADVTADVISTTFGTKQEIAQRYLAAHRLTLSLPSNLRNPNVAGPLSAESTGKVSRSYGKGSYVGADRNDETSYGRMFNQIKRSRCIGFKVITP